MPLSYFSCSEESGLELVVETCALLRVESWNYPLANTLDYWVYYWNPTPGGVMEFDGSRYAMTPDRAFLIAPYTTYRTWNEGTFDHFHIRFAGTGSLRRIVRQFFEIAPHGFADLLNRLEKGSKIERKIVVRSLLYEALAQLPREVFTGVGAKGIDERIVETITAFQKRPDKPLTNEEAARRCGLSPSRFQKLFLSETGISPHQYLLRVRLENARSMLLALDRPALDEIASQCGFADRYAFSKAFRKYFGMPPGSYRASSGRA